MAFGGRSGVFVRAVFGLAAAALLFAADPAFAGDQMRFRLVSRGCPEAGCVVASGEISPASAKTFAAFLKAHAVRPGALVLLNSPGGDLVQGLKLGLMIRRAGLNTRVQAFDAATGDFASGGQCASACAYAFLGGLERNVPDDARYGVHRFYAASRAAPIDAATSLKFVSLIFNYLDGVGVDEQVGLAAFATPPDAMQWLTRQQLADLHVTPGSPAFKAAVALPDPPAKAGVVAELAHAPPVAEGAQ